MTAPLAIIEDELPDVLLTGETPQKEVMQDGIVQHDDTRLFQRLPVNPGVKCIIAEMIQIDTRPAEAIQCGTQRFRIIRDPRTGARRRRMMPGGAQTLFLRPKSAVPTRTQVAPSSIATSRSFDMPMESSGIAKRPAISRNLAK